MKNFITLSEEFWFSLEQAATHLFNPSLFIENISKSTFDHDQIKIWIVMEESISVNARDKIDFIT